MEKLDIAMIMDGNRRFAKKRGLPAVKGHEFGAKKLEEVLKWSKNKAINSLTLYTFSTDNFKRSKKEVDYIFKLFLRYFKDIQNKLQTKEFEGLKIKFLGRLSMFPKDIQEACKVLEEKTKDNDKYLLQFCFAYNGRLEIVDAVKKITKQGVKEEEITEELIQNNLYMSIEPDIIIRTSGEHRLSGFLTWQSIYSEWFFLKQTWPEVTIDDLEEVIDSYNKREIRKGK